MRQRTLAHSRAFRMGRLVIPTALLCLLPALAGGLPASRGDGFASTTDGRGVATSYQYDGAGRLTSVTCAGQSITVSYDLAGRPLTVSGPNGVIEYAYDPVHRRLIGVTTTGSGPTYQVSYSYYPDGKVATMTSPVGTTSYSYDAAGRMVALTDPSGALTTWTYDAVGRVTSETTTAGATTISTSYGYGPSGQPGDPSTAPAYLRTITQTVNGQPFQQYTLTHSYLGQLLQQVGTGAATENGQWSYDARGRLTGSSIQYQSGGLNYAYTGAYQYDLANNLQGGTGGWTHNTNNQVTSAPAMGGLSGATGLGYDASGNLTSINGATLAYNAWGDMIADGTAAYAYDAFGRRISKTVGGQTTYYRYDDGALIAETDAQGNIVRSYTWGACGVIGGTSGGQPVRCLYDGMGNKRFELNATGAVTWRGAYSDFGEVAQTLPPALPMGYQGRYGVTTDSSSGMLWNGSRYYAPTIGRHVQPSGPGYVGGNPYAYTPPPQEDAPDAGILPDNWNGEQFYYHGKQGGLYQAANVLKTGLLTAASFNPLCVLSEAISGQNAAGDKVSKVQRGLDILMLAAGPLVKGLGALKWIGKYQDVGGHHIFAKAAFQGVHGYYPGEALAVGSRYLKWRGVWHPALTRNQQRMFAELHEAIAAGKAQNTLRRHAAIAHRVLYEGGLTWVEAKVLTWLAFRQLVRRGITAPSRIPWH